MSYDVQRAVKPDTSCGDNSKRKAWSIKYCKDSGWLILTKWFEDSSKTTWISNTGMSRTRQTPRSIQAHIQVSHHKQRQSNDEYVKRPQFLLVDVLSTNVGLVDNSEHLGELEY